MTVSCTSIVIVDVVGSLAMMVISFFCLRVSMAISRARPESVFYSYLNWLVAALFAFSLSRPLGHIVKHVLIATGNKELWADLSPVSGSINTAVFFLIAAITIFFRKMHQVMEQMGKNKKKIEMISQQLLALNQNTEILVAERTRSELALSVAHEIRNPVTIIGGMIRRIMKKPMSEEETRKFLKVIMAQVARLENIVNKFETIKEEPRWAFETVDLNSLVEAAVEMILPEAEERDISIDVHTEESPLPVEVNANLIKLGIVHCIRNAIEASSRGSSMQVETRRAKYGAVVKIIDHGTGMSKAVQEKVFTPFFGTKKKSSGLGLCVVKQIMEEHGGTISISSVEGKGTVVEIFLPSKIGTANTWSTDGQRPEGLACKENIEKK